MSEHTTAEYAYFELLYPVRRPAAPLKFIRLAKSTLDEEWAEMRAQPGRTFPFVTFDFSSRTLHDYSAVLIGPRCLRRLHGARAALIERAWTSAELCQAWPEPAPEPAPASCG